MRRRLLVPITKTLAAFLRSDITPPPPVPIASTRGPTWAWEYAALALSAVALFLLLAFFAYIHDMRLSHWKFPVSPTAVVSIIAATARAPLGFAISSCLAQAKWNWLKKRPGSLVTFDRIDDASRGPWGSLWLLLRVGVKHMVAVGAAATVLLLAFDPFLQAIISFDGSVMPSEGALPAYISRSERIDAGVYFVDTSVDADHYLTTLRRPPRWFHRVSCRPDSGLVSAYYSGLDSRTARMQTASSTCATANCSWTPFTTLAICSECHDVTSYVERFEFDKRIKWELETLRLENTRDARKSVDSKWMSVRNRRLNYDTLSFENFTTMIMAVQVMRAAEEYEKGEVVWADTNVTVTECALYFCVNAYKSSMKQGILEEVLLGSWSKRDLTSYANISGEGDAHLTQLFDERNNYSFYYDIVNLSNDPMPLDTFRSDLRLLIPADEVQRLDLPENTTTSFNLTSNTVGILVLYLTSALTPNEVKWSQDLNSPIAPYSEAPMVEALASSTNLSDTFNNVARSVTSWMRDTSNGTHRGETQEWTITVQIEWQYVTAPLAAFVAGVLFCLFIIWETGRLGLPPWKTGMIATLTHSLDATTREQLRNASRDGSLDKVAQATVVQLDDAGSGLEMKAKQVQS
ncbi:hypothetical protein F5Y14DRAFT_438998 [Nemania sp. NC0429]|nr:hypothetical protein F5Y14DRAFT_438998 [Nemania sp. NC0429]